MFKKEFGVSVYPEHSDLETVKKYLDKAKECGFTQVFMSWFQIRNKQKDRTLDKAVIDYAKELGMYVILDIHDNDFKFYESLGVDCVRLDYPVLPGEVSIATYLTKLDIQIDISGNNSFINQILECQPVAENLYGVHNFYPSVNTGLGWDRFKKATKRFNDLGINAGAFVNSQFGEYSAQAYPLENGVVTVEELRTKPLRSQFKYMLATKQIDTIYIGNQFATDDELESIKTIDTKRVEFDLVLAKELSELEMKNITSDGTNHWYRADTGEYYFRSTMPRLDFEKETLEYDGLENKPLTRGDVIIFNHNEANYENELVIIKQDIKNLDPIRYNYIGRIADYDLGLLDIIKESQAFKFRIVK